MSDFHVTILGNGSAVPTSNQHPSSQIVKMTGLQFMIDCGEGTQIQMIKYGLKHRNLDHIFISHLHGDHYFGIFGLISTFHLFGRSNPLNIYAPLDLKELIDHQLRISRTNLKFGINFYPLENAGNVPILLYNDYAVNVFPLYHRIPTWGIRIKKEQTERNIDKGFISKHQPGIDQILRIKKGEDFYTKKGEVLRNEDITLSPKPALSYAYCSDTAYNENLIPVIKNADLLYHEATFNSSMEDIAGDKFHTTSAQAALMAKKSKAGKLLLGHYSARFEDLNSLLDEARQVFPYTILSEEGKTYEIGES
jgi:ribonuclease Z